MSDRLLSPASKPLGSIGRRRTKSKGNKSEWVSTSAGDVLVQRPTSPMPPSQRGHVDFPSASGSGSRHSLSEFARKRSSRGGSVASSVASASLSSHPENHHHSPSAADVPIQDVGLGASANGGPIVTIVSPNNANNTMSKDSDGEDAFGVDMSKLTAMANGGENQGPVITFGSVNNAEHPFAVFKDDPPAASNGGDTGSGGGGPLVRKTTSGALNPVGAKPQRRASLWTQELTDAGIPLRPRNKSLSSISPRGGDREREMSIARTPRSARKSMIEDDMASRRPAPKDVREEQKQQKEKARALYHPLWLTFNDPAMEASYKRWFYEDTHFYGGKLWSVLVVIIALVFAVGYNPHITSSSSSSSSDENDVELWNDWKWMPLIVDLILSIILGAAMFLKALAPFRETIFLLSAVVHLPVLQLTCLHGKEPNTLAYVYIIVSYYYCTFIAQVRFCRAVFVVAVVPAITMFIFTFGLDDYWQDTRHSMMEMFWWLMVIPPQLLLRYFEAFTRTAYVQVQESTGKIEKLKEKMESTHVLISQLFPETASRLLVNSGASHSPRTKKLSIPVVRHRSAVLIVTDIVNFTAWTAASDPALVVDFLSELFMMIDDFACKKVEKISAVGDSYVGCIFAETKRYDIKSPSSKSRRKKKKRTNTNTSSTDPELDGLPSNLMMRCAQAARFALDCQNIRKIDVLEKHSKVVPVAMRLGVHHGDVVGSFIGRAPLKYDVFGEAMEKAKLLEQTGLSPFVHISTETMNLLEKEFTMETNGSAFGGEQELAPIGSLVSKMTRKKSTTSHLNALNLANENNSRSFDIDSEDSDYASVQASDDPAANGGNAGAQTEEEEFFANKEHLLAVSRALCNLAQHNDDEFDAEGGVYAMASQCVFGEDEYDVIDDGREHSMSMMTDGASTFAGASTFRGDDGRSVGRSTAYTIAKSKLGVPEIDDEATQGEYGQGSVDKRKISIFTLIFENPLLEAAYEEFRGATNITEACAWFFILVEALNFGTQLVIICLNTTQDSLANKFLTFVQFFVSVAFAGYLVTCFSGGSSGGRKQYKRLPKAEADLGDMQEFQDGTLTAKTGAAGATTAGENDEVVFISTDYTRITVPFMIYFNLMAILSSFITAEVGCAAYDIVYYVHQLIGVYYLLALLACQFLMHVSFPKRILTNILSLGLLYVVTAVRRAVYKDEVMIYEYGMILVMIATSCQSYFLEFTLRTVFVLRDELTDVKDQQHALIYKALKVMLPSFVIYRQAEIGELMKREAEKVEHNSSSDAEEEAVEVIAHDSDSEGSVDLDEDDEEDSPGQQNLQSGSGMTRTASGRFAPSSGGLLGVPKLSNLPGANSVSGRRNSARSQNISEKNKENSKALTAFSAHQSHLLWEYPQAIICFIHIVMPDEKEVDKLDMTVRFVEKICSSYNMLKIKSVGTTILVAGGLDNTTLRTEQSDATIEGAAECVKELHSVALSPLWEHFTIGLHVGPCFGAVMGKNGVCFDVFGDTVNTTSRVQTTAPDQVIRCSEDFATVLIEKGELEIKHVERAVSVKGKGKMKVCEICMDN